MLAWAQTSTQNGSNDAKSAEEGKLEPLQQSIRVIGQIETESPAFISVLGRPQLAQIPGVNLDDRLRNIPGFSMFRRTSSVTANPTTQGVSLRGLGSSGASRTLLLWDGIPVNSPFGGWIYWTRLDPYEFERVEMSRGASTSVWGDKAMGGALNMFTRQPEPWRMTLAAKGGNKGTVELTGGMSHVWKQRFGASANIRTFDTDGYFIVPTRFRGPIDTPAGVRFVSGVTRFDYLGARDRVFVRIDTLAEERANGTRLVGNSTGLGTLAANWSRQMSRDGFSVSAFHTRESYHAGFSAIGAGRQTETLTFTQAAPSEATGVGGIYRRAFGDWNALFGGDYQRVEGSSTDYLRPTGVRFGEGIRNARGFFTQWYGRLGPANLFLGAREDFMGVGKSFFSPSGGVTVGRGMVRGRASLYRSFRAPTLNELYRVFRAGNAQTNANPDLEPETLFGAEVGVDLVGESRRFSVTLFRNSVDKVITNVTLSTTPQLITRQRQNAAVAQTYGIEANARQNWGRFQGELSYLFADSSYGSSNLTPQLIGLRIPQVAKHQGTAQLSWSRPGTFIAAGLRAYSLQFENDQNTLILPGYSTIQLAAQQQIVRSLSATFEIDNLLDHEYWTGLTTGATGAPNIGSPFLFRVGLRWDGSIRR
jgi:outer membrane cobalamin receptor